MIRSLRLAARSLALLAAAALAIQPVAAQSVLRDAETEALLHDMADPIIAAAGLDPRIVYPDSPYGDFNDWLLASRPPARDRT